MRLRPDAVLPGAPIRRQPVLPRDVDPRRHSLHHDPRPPIRLRRRLPPEHRHDIREPLHPDRLAPHLQPGLHQSQSGHLHRGDLAVQLRPPDPHTPGCVGCLRLRHQARHLLHKERRQRTLLEDGHVRDRFRLAVRRDRPLLRQHLLGGAEVAQEAQAAQFRRGLQAQRDEDHEDGVGDFCLFRGVLPPHHHRQDFRPRCEQPAPPRAGVHPDLHFVVRESGGLCHDEQTVPTGVFGHSEVSDEHQRGLTAHANTSQSNAHVRRLSQNRSQQFP